MRRSWWGTLAAPLLSAIRWDTKATRGACGDADGAASPAQEVTLSAVVAEAAPSREGQGRGRVRRRQMAARKERGARTRRALSFRDHGEDHRAPPLVAERGHLSSCPTSTPAIADGAVAPRRVPCAAAPCALECGRAVFFRTHFRTGSNAQAGTPARSTTHNGSLTEEQCDELGSSLRVLAAVWASLPMGDKLQYVAASSHFKRHAATGGRDSLDDALADFMGSAATRAGPWAGQSSKGTLARSATRFISDGGHAHTALASSSEFVDHPDAPDRPHVIGSLTAPVIHHFVCDELLAESAARPQGAARPGAAAEAARCATARFSAEVDAQAAGIYAACSVNRRTSNFTEALRDYRRAHAAN